MVLFCPQLVCDLVCLLQIHLLTLSWPCSALSGYVIWSVCCNPSSDPLVALFCPQNVCDLVCLLQIHLLTLMVLFPLQYVCMFIANPSSDPLMALFCLQYV